MSSKTGHQDSCTRCGSIAPPFYKSEEMDEDTGEVIIHNLCWNCDWDLMNGNGDMDEDVGEILQDRAERAYEYDPINNQRPY